jgi:hypothetical protein
VTVLVSETDCCVLSVLKGINCSFRSKYTIFLFVVCDIWWKELMSNGVNPDIKSWSCGLGFGCKVNNPTHDTISSQPNLAGRLGGGGP